MNRRIIRLFIVLWICGGLMNLNYGEDKLPVRIPEKFGYEQLKAYSVDCLLTIETIQACIKDGNANGLVLDLSAIDKLLDGTIIKPGEVFGGVAYIGPYPFEAKETTYTYKRYRHRLLIQNSKAFLPVGFFLQGYRNSEDWTDQGQVMIRLKLYHQTTESVTMIGYYDTVVGFKKTTGPQGKIKYVRTPVLVEGPSVNLLNSDDPSSIVVAFKTDKPRRAKVVLNDGRWFKSSKPSIRHQIKVTGLKPDTEYSYHVVLEDLEGLENLENKKYTFQTAPMAGEGEVIFAYSGDSRAGVGEGDYDLMGVNYATMERLANLAYMKNADLFIFGGDLINGFTTSPDDFRTQMHAYKQAMAGFWNHRPVYPCIGNHEALLNIYKNKSHNMLTLDKWPYDTHSAEAVFADELVNPVNGPEPSDPRRPSYKENVFSFQYGPVLFIAFNNNYWVARNLDKREGPWRTGGSPEGYMMDDQLEWLQKELDKGAKNKTVKYIIMYAQEPVFPNGGHISDSMWYLGNNAVRAYSFDAKANKVVAEKKGIIDVRNELVNMIAANPKVAAVMGSDEHSYHKILIDKNVPIGVPATDTAEGSSVVCKEGGSCSPLKTLANPVWYLVSGGAGAPYYSYEPTPWNLYWKNFSGEMPRHTSLKGCFYYSSQENVFIFKASKDKLSLMVYNPYGEVIDRIDDMLSVKKASR